MSAFDIKPISEEDAFKLEVAKTEEAQSERNGDPGNAEPSAAFTNDASPVAEVVEQIMSHWAEADETSAHEAAEKSGDDKLQRIVGEAASDQQGPKEGIEGDFKADVAGPDDGIEVPPKADGGEFGGGGGGAGGGGEAEGLPAWMQDEGGIADPGDPGEAGELPGFPSEMETNANYGGDGEGDGDDEDEDDELPITPPDPKKPKKP